MRIVIGPTGFHTAVYANDGRNITADLQLERIEVSTSVDELTRARLLCTAPDQVVVDVPDFRVEGADFFSWRRSKLEARLFGVAAVAGYS